MRNGPGQEINPNGYITIGVRVKDKLNGHCKYISNSMTQEGEKRDGKNHGYAVDKYANGGQFRG